MQEYKTLCDLNNMKWYIEYTQYNSSFQPLPHDVLPLTTAHENDVD